MDVLRELTNVAQSADAHRRWFSSDALDLIVWYDESGSAQGFHLCYDKEHVERAIVWSTNGGLSSATVDDGEGDLSRHKGSPILKIDPEMNADLARVVQLFTRSCGELPHDIIDLVNGTLSQAMT